MILNDNLQRESHLVRSSYLSRVIAATMYQKSGVHFCPPTCYCTGHLVYRKWPGGPLLLYWLPVCHSSTKPQSLRVLQHDRAHSLHFWHESTLANCSYAWSRRLRGIARIILKQRRVSYQLLPQESQPSCLLLDRTHIRCRHPVHYLTPCRHNRTAFTHIHSVHLCHCTTRIERNWGCDFLAYVIPLCC
jgi:hypothetical protein